MKNNIQLVTKELKALHRRLLENERIETEKTVERRMSAFDFLHLLVVDPSLSWLQPMSALISEIDAFVDSSEDFDRSDFDGVVTQIRLVLDKPDGKLARALDWYSKVDPEFIMLNANLKRALNMFSKKTESSSNLATA